MMKKYILSLLLIFLFQLTSPRPIILSQLSVDSTILEFMLCGSQSQTCTCNDLAQGQHQALVTHTLPRRSFFPLLTRTAQTYLWPGQNISPVPGQQGKHFLSKLRDGVCVSGWIRRLQALCPMCAVSSWELRILNTRYYILFREQGLSETIHRPELQVTPSLFSDV